MSNVPFGKEYFNTKDDILLQASGSEEVIDTEAPPPNEDTGLEKKSLQKLNKQEEEEIRQSPTKRRKIEEKKYVRGEEKAPPGAPLPVLQRPTQPRASTSGSQEAVDLETPFTEDARVEKKNVHKLNAEEEFRHSPTKRRKQIEEKKGGEEEKAPPAGPLLPSDPQRPMRHDKGTPQLPGTEVGLSERDARKKKEEEIRQSPTKRRKIEEKKRAGGEEKAPPSGPLLPSDPQRPMRHDKGTPQLPGTEIGASASEKKDSGTMRRTPGTYLWNTHV